MGYRDIPLPDHRAGMTHRDNTRPFERGYLSSFSELVDPRPHPQPTPPPIERTKTTKVRPALSRHKGPQGRLRTGRWAAGLWHKADRDDPQRCAPAPNGWELRPSVESIPGPIRVSPLPMRVDTPVTITSKPRRPQTARPSSPYQSGRFKQLEAKVAQAESAGDPARAVTAKRNLRVAQRKAALQEVSRAMKQLQSSDWKDRAKACAKLMLLEVYDVAPHIEALGEALEDFEPRVRADTLGVLARLGWRSLSLAPAIVARLDDSNWHVREAAAKAIGRLGEGGRLVGMQVAARLRSTKWHRQLAAVDALAAMGSNAQGTAEEVAMLLGRSDSDWVKSSAMQALSHMGRRGAKYAIKVMEEGFRDPDAMDRRAAVKAIGGMREEADSFITHLTGLYQEESAGVRCCVIEAFARLGYAVALPHVQLIVSALEDSAWQVRKAAVETLAELCKEWDGSDQRPELQWMKAVAGRLWDQDWSVRCCVEDTLHVAILQEKESNQAMSLLASLAAPDVAAAAKPSAIGAMVVEALQSEHAWVRLSATECLGRLGLAGVEFAEQIGRNQHDADVRVAKAVRQALEGMGDEGEFQLLRQNEGLQRLMALKWDLELKAAAGKLLTVWRASMLDAAMVAVQRRREAKARQDAFEKKKAGADDW